MDFRDVMIEEEVSPMGKATQALAGRDRARDARLKAARERRLQLDPDLSSTGFDGGMEFTLGRLLSGNEGLVVGLVLDGRDEADFAVQAPVVEPVDVLGDRDFEVVDVLPRAAVADELGLEQRVECLGEGVDAPISVKRPRWPVEDSRVAVASRPRVRGRGVVSSSG